MKSLTASFDVSALRPSIYHSPRKPSRRPIKDYIIFYNSLVKITLHTPYNTHVQHFTCTITGLRRINFCMSNHFPRVSSSLRMVILEGFLEDISYSRIWISISLSGKGQCGL